MKKEISQIIKERLIKENARYFANDNISKYIKPGELDLLQDELRDKFQKVIEALVIDTKRDHNIIDTANRISKMYIREIFKGRYEARPKITNFPNFKKYDQIYTVGPSTVRGTCCHHFQNITGRCWAGIFPGEKVTGLSKFSRIIDWVSSRPSIQEEMTEQIADVIQTVTEAKGVIVVIQAEHACMSHRGVKEPDSNMITSVVRGYFKQNTHLKNEALSLMYGLNHRRM